MFYVSLRILVGNVFYGLFHLCLHYSPLVKSWRDTITFVSLNLKQKPKVMLKVMLV